MFATLCKKLWVGLARAYSRIYQTWLLFLSHCCYFYRTRVYTQADAPPYVMHAACCGRDGFYIPYHYYYYYYSFVLLLLFVLLLVIVLLQILVLLLVLVLLPQYYLSTNRTTITNTRTASSTNSTKV